MSLPSDDGLACVADPYERIHVGQVLIGTAPACAVRRFVERRGLQSPGLAEFFDEDWRGDAIELPHVGNQLSCILLGFRRLATGRTQARLGLRQSRPRRPQLSWPASKSTITRRRRRCCTYTPPALPGGDESNALTSRPAFSNAGEPCAGLSQVFSFFDCDKAACRQACP